jgi:cobalt-zinc-cadmium efflux system protein
MANCNHHHDVTNANRAFLIAIVANGFFVVLQIIFARLAHSTSLFADAIHNLGDVLSLIVAWIGNYLLIKKATDRTTYGLKKASILAALANVILLVFTCGLIAAEAIFKFFNPGPINSLFVIIVAAIGVFINAGTAFLFIKDDGDINLRAAYLHLASDAAVSLGVVITAALYWVTNWTWLDPMVGLLIAVLILRSTWSVLLDSTRLILDGVPKSISYSDVQNLLLSQPGVVEVHDLHIWAMSTKENALSAHLLIPNGSMSDKERLELSEVLKSRHNIHHLTIQIEANSEYCFHRC